MYHNTDFGFNNSIKQFRGQLDHALDLYQKALQAARTMFTDQKQSCDELELPDLSLAKACIVDMSACKRFPLLQNPETVPFFQRSQAN